MEKDWEWELEWGGVWNQGKGPNCGKDLFLGDRAESSKARSWGDSKPIPWMTDPKLPLDKGQGVWVELNLQRGC